jgi:hypothetical protein
MKSRPLAWREFLKAHKKLAHNCLGQQQQKDMIYHPVGDNVIDDRAGFNDPGPAHDARHAESAFPVYILLATERVQISRAVFAME